MLTFTSAAHLSQDGRERHSIIDTRTGEGFRPEVSLVVPVFNVEFFVEECLQSIIANLSEVCLEIIVIDDGSTDSSARVVEALLNDSQCPEVLFLRQSNKGLSAVRNLGAWLARGAYIGFLDSDDRLSPGALRRMLDLANSANADVVLGRTEIFDPIKNSRTQFYDANIWKTMVRNRPSRVLHVAESPLLLSLEPNANYRLIRREFYHKKSLHYPEGLVFEDAPVHFRMLLKAKRVALLNDIYYNYRVNRPGKITEEKGDRRFDVLKVVRLALSELKSIGVTAEQGARALRVLFRLIWGCGTMTLPDQRRAFFAGACTLVRDEVPRSWSACYRMQNWRNPRHLVLGELLLGDGQSLLIAISLGRRPIIPLAGFLICATRGQPEIPATPHG